MRSADYENLTDLTFGYENLGIYNRREQFLDLVLLSRVSKLGLITRGYKHGGIDR